MLVNQAHALQAMFVNLAERAQNQTYLSQIQTLMTLALKAQAQCRATLQTLAEVRFPKSATFIRQANIAGQQQVNNAQASEASRTGKSENQPNKLLENPHGERLEFGATGTACSANSMLEAVGTVHRPQDAGS